MVQCVYLCWDYFHAGKNNVIFLLLIQVIYFDTGKYISLNYKLTKSLI